MKKIIWATLSIQVTAVIALIAVLGSLNSLTAPQGELDLSRFRQVNLSIPSKMNSLPSVEIVVFDSIVEELVENTTIRPGKLVAIQPLEGHERVVVAETYRNENNIDNHDEIVIEERFQHFGFEIEPNNIKKISWAHYFEAQDVERKLLALNENVRTRERSEDDFLLSMADEVSHQLSAASEPMNDRNNQVSEIENNDQDLVFIDYSERDKPSQVSETAHDDPLLSIQEEVTNSLAQQQPKDVNNMIDDLVGQHKISEDVFAALDRELGKKMVDTTPKLASTSNASVTTQRGQTASDVINEVMSSQDGPIGPGQSLMQSGYSRNIIKPYTVNIDGDGRTRSLKNIEFFVETMPEARMNDRGEGAILAEFKLNGEMSVVRGTLLSHGMVRTKVELTLEEGEFEFEVPVFSAHELSGFLDRESLDGHGGFLLVQLDKNTDSVEIDSHYEAKIFLNRSFKVVEQAEEHDYILFAGVTPGNSLLSFRNFRSEVAQKIVHITEDEVLFDGGITYRAESSELELRSINVLGRSSSILDVRGSDLRYFNTNSTATKVGAGRYLLVNAYNALGMRRYYELQQNNGSIFLGRGNNKTVHVPSGELIYHVLEAHGLRGLNNACMVQVNFTNEVAYAQAYGESPNGPMQLIKSYLDSDGYWSGEATELSKHLFIIGDYQGAISVRVDYIDGSSDYLQTFCSNDTYLVEQL